MLIDSLIKDGWLKTPIIIEAFKKIKREDFLPQDIKNLAELNEALPIGWGQTISQPLTVAFMLELLQPEPGNKILDIGSGSGYTAALLAEIVSQNKNIKNFYTSKYRSDKYRSRSEGGRVVALEVIPELKEFGEKNVAKYNFIEKGIAEFILADGLKGYKKEAPYDKILVSASAKEIPPAWKEQLKIKGRIVASVKNSLWLIKKATKDKFIETEYPGFVFVPLV
jgi:protein-L-isoaspartate(D-aspartate) O-methyltransferase